jgi:hypothetical protein
MSRVCTPRLAQVTSLRNEDGTCQAKPPSGSRRLTTKSRIMAASASSTTKICACRSCTSSKPAARHSTAPWSNESSAAARPTASVTQRTQRPRSSSVSTSRPHHEQRPGRLETEGGVRRSASLCLGGGPFRRPAAARCVKEHCPTCRSPAHHPRPVGRPSDTARWSRAAPPARSRPDGAEAHSRHLRALSKSGSDDRVAEGAGLPHGPGESPQLAHRRSGRRDAVPGQFTYVRGRLPPGRFAPRARLFQPSLPLASVGSLPGQPSRAAGSDHAGRGDPARRVDRGAIPRRSGGWGRSCRRGPA